MSLLCIGSKQSESLRQNRRQQQIERQFARRRELFFEGNYKKHIIFFVTYSTLAFFTQDTKNEFGMTLYLSYPQLHYLNSCSTSPHCMKQNHLPNLEDSFASQFFLFLYWVSITQWSHRQWPAWTRYLKYLAWSCDHSSSDSRDRGRACGHRLYHGTSSHFLGHAPRISADFE